MVRKVQDRRDEGQAEEEEKDRVEDELLNRRKDIHAVRDLKLVDLELDPFAESLEGVRRGRGGRHLCGLRSRWRLFGDGDFEYSARGLFNWYSLQEVALRRLDVVAVNRRLSLSMSLSLSLPLSLVAVAVVPR